MIKDPKLRKRVVVSYQNLAEELQEELKRKYPAGFSDVMIRVDKGAGVFFYAVMLDTEDTSYLVKVDVKVDDTSQEEEDDKDDDDYYDDDDIKGADEISDDADGEDN